MRKRAAAPAEDLTPAQREDRAVDEACAAFMAKPEFAPLRRWWEAEATFAVMPAGPVDPLRLAMTQGDRERFVYIRERAGRHEARKRMENLRA